MLKAQDGDTVTVLYQGILEDGSIFDSSAEDDQGATRRRFRHPP
jgi:FKBP-type peptidyl-prolyl cis-trans isomerase